MLVLLRLGEWEKVEDISIATFNSGRVAVEFMQPLPRYPVRPTPTGIAGVRVEFYTVGLKKNGMYIFQAEG